MHTDGCTKLARLTDPAPAAWISVPEAAARSGRPERTIRSQCRRWRNMGRATNHAGEWRIDPSVDAAFAALARADDARAELLDVRQVSAAKRSAANTRRRILADVDAFVAERVAEGRMDRVAALQAFVAAHRTDDGRSDYGIKLSVRTIYRWQRRRTVAPNSGLIDNRGLTGGGAREPDADLVELFKARFFTGNRLSMRAIYDELVLYADTRGRWVWGSEKSFVRWVHATWPKAALVLNRQGDHAYTRECEPCLDQDPEQWTAGQLFVGDHHRFRAFVRYQGRIIRPWISAWIDQRSLLFVGWMITPQPNKTHICASFAVACRQYGPPREALTDNGEDYSSYSVAANKGRRTHKRRRPYTEEERSEIAGLFGLVGTQIRFALPASPNGKIIEGLFKPLEEEYVRRLPNYCGADPEDRPFDLKDRLNDPQQIPTFDDFAAGTDRWLREVYPVYPRSGKYCAGLSPRQVWDAKRGPVTALADPKVLDLLDQVWERPVKIGRNGVRCQNIYYGKWHPALIALQGQKVRVSYDPGNINTVQVWTMDHQWLCAAQQNGLRNRHEPMTDEDRRAGFRLKAQLRKALRVTSELGHLRYADASDLAIAAQLHAARRKTIDAPNGVPGNAQCGTGILPVTVRLVHTPLDGQSDRVRRAVEPPPPESLAPAPELMRERLRAEPRARDEYADLLDLSAVAGDGPALEYVDLPAPAGAAEAVDNDIMDRLRTDDGN